MSENTTGHCQKCGCSVFSDVALCFVCERTSYLEVQIAALKKRVDELELDAVTWRMAKEQG